MARTNSHRIALFLDFENLVTNSGITPATFDLQPTVNKLLDSGKVIYRRAYADWSRFKDAKAHLHKLGVDLVEVPPSTHAGKNGADMRLVIDALELCYAREYIDTFVIGSGDSDFCPLAYKLRENNRHVVGVGAKESTSRLFVTACDEFIYLKAPQAKRRATSSAEEADGAERSPSVANAPNKKRSTVRRAQPVAEEREPIASRVSGGGPEGRAAAEASKSGGAEMALDESAQAADSAEGRRTLRAESASARRARKAELPPVAREVVAGLLSRASGPINPSLIKETIVKRQSDFDERAHGFATFTKLLEAMEREGLLSRQQQGKSRQWYVLAPERPAPPEGEAPKAAVEQGAAESPKQLAGNDEPLDL